MDPVTRRLHASVRAAKEAAPSGSTEVRKRNVVLGLWLCSTVPFAPLTIAWGLVTVPIACYKARKNARKNASE